MSKYLIGIDIGTQGTKAALYTSEMELICTSFEQSNLISPEPGTVWQEADDLYGSCARTIRELLDKSSINRESVVGIGIDGQMAGIMGIDGKGEASTYYDSWLDMRSRDFADLMQKQSGDKMVASSGGQITCNHASKILWWKHNHPDVYDKTAKFVLPHGYVVGKMTGKTAEEAVFDYTCLHFNSFSDNKNKKWNEDLLQEYGVASSKMPRVASPFEVVGGITDEFASLSGLPSGVPVVVGAGDTAASTFGAGIFQKGMIQDCAGTASVMCCVVDEYVPDVTAKTLNMMRSPVDGLWLPLAYINGGGLCLRWFRNNLTGIPNVTYNDMNIEAEKIPAGSEGLLFCPHFSGRVLPLDANMKGSYMGLDHKHTRAHMYRAVMEGIAYEYYYYLSVLKDNYPNENFENMIVIGGGSSSSLFNQIKADVLGIRVNTFETADTALIGSAVIAGSAVGLWDDYTKVISRTMQKKDEYTPNPANKDVYQKACLDYQRMLKSISLFYN